MNGDIGKVGLAWGWRFFLISVLLQGGKERDLSVIGRTEGSFLW